MDHILTNYSYPITIKKLHACRLYLQVTLLSDITNLKGDKVLTNRLHDIREKHRPSAYDWHRQQRPNAHSWKLWKKMLQKLYCSPNSHFIRTPLRLRKWEYYSTVLHRYLYSPLEQEIHQRDHSNITEWFALKPTRKYISVIPSTNSKCTSLPPDIYPITPINHTIFKIEPSTAIITPSPAFCKDFADYIQSLPQWISILISNFRTNPLSDSLVQYTQQHIPLYISTEGSRTNKKRGEVGSFPSLMAQK